MSKFEVLMNSGIAYVRGDGIKIEGGFICIYEEVEVERPIFNPLPQITGTQTEKVIKEKVIHIFNADSVISVTEESECKLSNESFKDFRDENKKGIETLLVTMAVEAGVDVAQVSKQVMKQLISQIENLQ